MSVTPDVPSRVAAETFRGDIQTGDVIDDQWTASTHQTEHRLLVAFDTHREWLAATETIPVDA